MSVDLEVMRGKLLEERKHVQDAIDNIRHENPGSLADETDELSFQDTNHPADNATETYDREMATTLLENELRHLAEVDAALQRLDDGAFGTCTSCGTPIGERLEVRPWARLCKDCKEKEERR